MFTNLRFAFFCYYAYPFESSLASHSDLATAKHYNAWSYIFLRNITNLNLDFTWVRLQICN